MKDTLPKTQTKDSANDKKKFDWEKMFRRLWWVVSIALTGYVIFVRFPSITSAQPTSFDTGLLAIVTILILLPFISEVSAFGFTVKKQINEAKKEIKQDVKEEVQTIRNEIFALGITNRLTSNVILQSGVPNPPPDNALNEIRSQINEMLKQFQHDRGLREVQPQPSNVSENTVFAFEQRYLVEQEVRRIWSTRIKDGDFYRYSSFSRMVDDLAKYELITSNLAPPLKEVYAVASAAIHGNEPSQEKIDFLRQVAPEVISTLSSIK
jgi:hypothetical protein